MNTTVDVRFELGVSIVIVKIFFESPRMKCVYQNQQLPAELTVVPPRQSRASHHGVFDGVALSTGS